MQNHITSTIPILERQAIVRILVAWCNIMKKLPEITKQEEMNNQEEKTHSLALFFYFRNSFFLKLCKFNLN